MCISVYLYMRIYIYIYMCVSVCVCICIYFTLCSVINPASSLTSIFHVLHLIILCILHMYINVVINGVALPQQWMLNEMK